MRIDEILDEYNSETLLTAARNCLTPAVFASLMAEDAEDVDEALERVRIIIDEDGEGEDRKIL